MRPEVIIIRMKLPDLSYERQLWKKDYIVIGIDEVGRGAFAGPLFVGGVIFQPTKNNKRIARLLSYGINDSKKLKPNARKMLSKVIQKEALAYHISSINVAKINRLGIGKTTFVAMRDVVKNLRENCHLSHVTGHMLKPKRFYVLVDGFYVKYLNGIGLKNQRGIVNGDNVSLSIAAASIIAKVARDNHMKKLSAKYKEYGWGKNKGYGTRDHQTAIRKFGKTKIHRDTFIKKVISP